mgnify:CR=1 FL=1
MDVEKQLLLEHSGKNTDRFVQWIGHDPSRVKVLVEIFLGDDPLLTQRAAPHPRGSLIPPQKKQQQNHPKSPPPTPRGGRPPTGTKPAVTWSARTAS